MTKMEPLVVVLVILLLIFGGPSGKHKFQSVAEARSLPNDRILSRPASPDNPESFTGKVTYIVDGDTFSMSTGGQLVRIRLSEIDTPEMDQPWSNKAKNLLWKKIHKKIVTIDVHAVDRYGRLVAKVWLGERDVCREMVREGYARVYRRFMYDKTLLADEQEAKNKRLGIWAYHQEGKR